MGALIAVAAIAVFVLILLAASVRVAREYERGVIFRLGRLQSPPKGPGLFFLIPIVDRMVRVDLRTVTLDVPPQDVITKDNVPVRVNAVAYFRVIDPEQAIVEIENFWSRRRRSPRRRCAACSASTTLDELLSERDKINAILQEIIDEHTAPWGIKVALVEIKDIELPDRHAAGDGTPGRGGARAPREGDRRRGRVPGLRAAEGGAQVIAENPMSLQLRFLQTMLEIGAEQLDDDLLPVPIDLFTPFLEATRRAGGTTT